VSTSTGQRDLRPERSTTGSTYQLDGWAVDIGADMPWLSNEDGVLTAGLVGRFAEGRSRSTSVLFGSGAADLHTRALSATLNWQARRGYYSDLQLQASATSSDLTLAGTPGADTNVDARGYAASIEVGYRGHRTWALTPQAQLQYSSTDYDAFTFNGISVGSGKVEGLQVRAGIALDHQNRWRGGNGNTQALHFYALLDVIQELDGKVSMDATGTPVVSEPQQSWGRATMGFTAALNDDSLSIFGEAAYQKAFDDGAANNGVGGRIGLRLAW